METGAPSSRRLSADNNAMRMGMIVKPAQTAAKTLMERRDLRPHLLQAVDIPKPVFINGLMDDRRAFRLGQQDHKRRCQSVMNPG